MLGSKPWNLLETGHCNLGDDLFPNEQRQGPDVDYLGAVSVLPHPQCHPGLSTQLGYSLLCALQSWKFFLSWSHRQFEKPPSAMLDWKISAPRKGRCADR